MCRVWWEWEDVCGKKDESGAVEGLRQHAEAYDVCPLSSGELWKLCEQMHAGHYPADTTLTTTEVLINYSNVHNFCLLYTSDAADDWLVV